MSELIDKKIIEVDFLPTIAEKYNLPLQSLLEDFKSVKKTRIAKSKYSCDHDFFSRDNEASFYWAGFLAADGCVFNRGNSYTLSLNLSEKDLAHLKRFKKDLSFDGIISKSVTKHSDKNPKWNDSIKRSLTISSFKIFQDLKRFNIQPNKTKSYTFPKWMISHEMVNHFLRGYIDGDGSFYYQKNRDRVCLEVRGTYEFLTTFKEVVDSCIEDSCKVRVTTPDSTSKLKYSGKKFVPKLVDFLYKNSNIYMLRKKEKATINRGDYELV